MKNEKEKYKQVELMPLPHGGKRENAGRKPIDQALKKPETVTIRIKKELLPEIERLKKGDCENGKSEFKEGLLKQIEIIKKHRDKAEELESKRKGDDLGQFAQILYIEAELNKLIEIISKF